MVQAARILVVDDEPVVTRGCKRVLDEVGYQVDTAATGRDGLNRAVEGQFDLVVTDLRLPDLSGMDLIRALRSRRPETAIVVITGFGTVANAVEAVKLGVSDYLEKPFTPEQITEAVRRAVAPQADVAKRPRIEADLVREVLRRAGQDGELSGRLLAEGSRVLSGYALSPAAKAAIVSGDMAWIEKEIGELSPEERAWLRQRLESEAW